MGRQYEERLLVAEYKRTVQVSTRQEHLEANNRTGQGPVRALAPLKRRRKKKMNTRIRSL
jgi:hypothetical protein